MKIEINRCMGCMSEKQYSGPCEICGYIDNDAYPSDCLAPRTFLADRYVLGKLMSKGGEGAVYLAFDTKLEKTVEIKEFMPDTLCRRAADGESVEIIDGAMPLFKSYLSEYADLHKTIMGGLADTVVAKTYDIFAANGTGYVVTEHADGVQLGEYLAQNGGIMTWGEASRLFPPVFDTLSAMHEKGIVHRGLSPETIYMKSDGTLGITSVAISAARTADSQINCEMSEGYAACEQYDLSERQGNWTDVYGISAVLYRVLTGVTPPGAKERKSSDTIIPADKVNPDIPAYVAAAISDGMRVSRTDRIHDIMTLRARLYDAPEEPEVQETGVQDDDGPITPTVHVKFDVEEREEQYIAKEKKKKKKKEKSRNIGTAFGLILFLSMVTALVIAIIYFSEESQNIKDSTVTAETSDSTIAITDEPDVTSATTTARTEPVQAITEATAEQLIVPDFVNRFYNQTLTSRYSLLQFEAEEEYSDAYSEGVIMEQDIPEGTMVTAGTVIHIKVSKGAAYTFLPDYVGIKLSNYTDKLTQLGIRYEAVAEETSEVKKGYVVRCSKDVGDKVYISQNEIVTVYYAVAPAQTTTAETKPPRTTTTRESLGEDFELPIDEDDDDIEVISGEE